MLEKKQKGIKEEYNLLDVHGRRLSRYWEPGDTFTSVVKKRIAARIALLFDPDTYSKEAMNDLR